MAILERTLTGDFTTILTELDAAVKRFGHAGRFQ